MIKNIHTAPELRTVIADLLAEELGTYPNNQPAIWVEPPSSPKGTVSGGLEVVISRFKNVSSSTLMLNNQQEQRYEWIISIKTTGDRTTSEYSKFTNAIDKMRQYFPRRRESISPFTETDNLIATFRLSELEILNNYL
jgi:pectate lyase